MKRIITIFLIIQAGLSIGQVLPEDQDLLRYWYYRDRLVKDFTLGIGDGFGQSLIFGSREAKNNHEPAPTHTIYMGDACVYQANYIEILALEYRLLTDYGDYESANSTLVELFYAINAINRLDFFADGDWTGQANSMNGFFIRDDVGRSFSWQNGEVNVNDPNYINALTNLNRGNPSLPEISSMHSDWWDYKHRIFTDPNNQSPDQNLWSNAESQDQINHLLLAFKTVIACVPPFIYPPAPLEFWDQKSYTEEVAAITKRMIDYVHPPGQNSYPENWKIKDPHGQNVHRGWVMYPVCYGFSKTYKNITGENNPRTGISAIDPFWWAAKSSFLFIVNSGAVFASQEGLKFLNHLVASGCCGINGLMINDLSYINPKYEAIHIPMLWQFIRGGIDFRTNTWYEDLLGGAPCQGPFNYYNQDYYSFNWSGNALTIWPERRGGDYNTPGKFRPGAGDYSGIDYMLLYNLYVRNRGAGSYPNLKSRKIISNYPSTITAPLTSVTYTYGDDVTPAYVVSVNKITAANTIFADGNATYRAGNEIDLLQDFTVETGGYFYGYIDPLHCNSSNEYYRNSSATDVTDETLVSTDKPEIIANSRMDFDAVSFPVPFVNTFNIRLTIPEDGPLIIQLFDLEGRLKANIFNGRALKGSHFLTFNLDNIENGYFLCKIISGKNTKSLKVIKSK